LLLKNFEDVPDRCLFLDWRMHLFKGQICEILAEGNLAAATDAIRHARSLAANSQNPEIRWQIAITAARSRPDKKTFPTPL
jgi:hypothetical protein